MNHIELFAGCGGLSLGLKHSGFNLTLANELSPMASESFAYNFLNENLEKLALEEKKSTKALWLNSSFCNLKSRLRENPLKFPAFDDPSAHSDIPENLSDLQGKLVIGSIVELNRLLDSNSELVDLLKSSFGNEQGLDLVSGGPPCQSFSMAGLREKNNEKNSLPWEFAKFVKHTQPKITLLENVTGILRPFKNDDGTSYYAWYEVAKVFAEIGYIPLCLHINASFAGIAQNRPRFIMIAIRRDHFYNKSLLETYPELFSNSLKFYDKIKKMGNSLEYGHLNYFDVNSPNDLNIIKKSFLVDLVNHPFVSVSEAIDDLKQNNPTIQSNFIKNLNNTFNLLQKRDQILNHEFRNNSEIVKRRFRLYQILADINNTSVTKSIFSVLKGEVEILPESTWMACLNYRFLQTDGTLDYFISKNDLLNYLKLHPTKKQTQKALIASSPAPAALSIPDDGCHYDEQELRVLTVREMARIQSFPDNFVFRSKVTTGGQMRKFEVPQYTQVGNAVPPLLGLQLGKCIAKLLG